MREHQTLDRLEEKVYVADHSLLDEVVDTEIKSFFEEILLRKRDEPFGEGLQACGVIYPDKVGLKIAEKDGKARHAHTLECISQYLDGEEKYSSIEGFGNPSTRKDDPHSWDLIDKYGFTITFSVGEKKIVIVIKNQQYKHSLFQFKVIEDLIKYARLCYEKGLIPEVSINYVTRQDRFFTNDESMDNNKFTELENIIATRKEAIKKVTI